MKIESVYFELTNLCNLNCQTCFNRSNLKFKKEQLSIDSLKKAFELFKSYGARSFMFGGGEPLLYDNIELLFNIFDVNPNYMFTFTTNGTIHNPQFIEYYKNHKNLYVQISLDGSCENVNSLTRGQENFNRAVNLIELLSQDNKRRRLKIKMVVSKYNLSDIPDYYRFAITHNCIPEFAFINKSGNGKDNWDKMELTVTEKMTALSYILENNNKYGLDIQMPYCAYGCPLANNLDNIELLCMVKSDGEIHPCQNLNDKQFALSNINNFNKKEFENNLQLVSQIVFSRKLLSFGCEDCLINVICNRGCLASAYMNNNDIYANDGDCEFRLKQYLKYILRKKK